MRCQILKIDIHTHTIKCKSGDPDTRNISPSDFCDTVLSTEVRIIAITNHNHFDLVQFQEIGTRLSDDTQVWPGIELDIVDCDSKGHLLVIVSPVIVEQFFAAVEQLVGDTKPDLFSANIDDVLKTFDSLNPLYIAHYKQKKPCLSDEVLEKLETKTQNPGCVIKEVTNSISAGIYISHGHSSIYGSDIQDWKQYEKISRELPDLRLPVDSFEHFILLLKKDFTTINTVLDRKTPEELILSPFGDDSTLGIKVFNDINIIFGSKGTGKSCILKAIAKYYSENGIDARVYESASDRLDEIFDTKGKDLSINLNNHGIDYCQDEITALLDASEVAVTSLSKYAAHFLAKNTNKNSKKILLKDIDPEEEGGIKQEFEQFNDAAGKTSDFLMFLTESRSVRTELKEEEFTEVVRILSELKDRLNKCEWDSFSGWKEVCLLNSVIQKVRSEVERKTGIPAKPAATGFRKYAINRVKIEANAVKIIKSVDTQIRMQSESVGCLGSDKGNLFFRTELKFQNGAITDGALTSLTGIKKGSQKKFVNCVRNILAHVHADDLFQYISELNEVEDVERINTVYELLLFKRYFALDDQNYMPSSGESAMVMLQKELAEDKDVYILDEPERSLGNDYINDIIVPLIKERARAGKRIFLSTHDANIAVRTLPYCSIYRCHGKNGYKTFIGNPFTNNLVNPNNIEDQLDWKKVSMRTLEGGEDAFGERGVIYGKN